MRAEVAEIGWVTAQPRNCATVSRFMRGFGPLGLLAILAILVAGIFAGPLGAALLVLLWRWLSKTPWADLGYVRPSLILIAIPAGILFKLVMKAVVMPLLGADPVNHAYHFLAGNKAAIRGCS